jgi:septal ring factor EnvC (AmiA/AmiB activator)
MLNKLAFGLLGVFVAVEAAPAVDVLSDSEEKVTYDAGSVAVMEYQVDGSLFQRIADLEQEKVLMQLEKEKSQLQLDLERLAAEQKKLQMESEAMDSRAEEQHAKLESDRLILIAEQEKLEQQRQRLAQQVAVSETAGNAAAPAAQQVLREETQPVVLSQKYRLLNVMGAGNQLQATVEDLSTGQRKKISAGRTLDGYNIRSISLDEGVTFTRDGEIETLSVGSK